MYNCVFCIVLCIFEEREEEKTVESTDYIHTDEFESLTAYVCTKITCLHSPN
jgi:hypothetical protein